MTFAATGLPTRLCGSRSTPFELALRSPCSSCENALREMRLKGMRCAIATRLRQIINKNA